jgi:7-cyano-7-deazaguanine synthase in queuosine biosynthesis
LDYREIESAAVFGGEEVMFENASCIQPREYSFDFTRPNKFFMRQPADAETDDSLSLPQEYFINDERISDSFCRILDPLFADWIDVALAVYLADRFALRRDRTKPYNSLQWGRIIHAKVSVRRPEIWTHPQVFDRLGKLLRFLTEDEWHLEFDPCPGQKRVSESNSFLFQMPSYERARVALFSGGLDSFAGAVQQLADFPDHSFVFVSGTTNARQQSGQEFQFCAITRALDRLIQHVVVPYGLKNTLYDRAEELSQRTRGFLFLSLGAITSLAAGARELYVYENGVGAINLPYDASQSIISNARAVNPIALLRMGDFITHLTGLPFRIENPFLYKTKAEMCRHPEVQRLAKYILQTFSCDGFPVRVKSKPQCGICTSCLLRRHSLESAGLTAFDPADAYLRDLLSTSFRGKARRLRALRAMEWQAQRIRMQLGKPDPWRALTLEFPLLRQVATEMCVLGGETQADVQAKLLKLYSTYVDEWEEFSARSLLAARATAD